ncbi:hypothetical protein MJA45_23700 [Paenibacillus aurantius]|uniref:Uncharacterized protein n=1 Tax=Paenibacillus aurantius TaxID=2918900 RepID=A0AA96LEG9_9BACL|nr:hypothetical protein [Paenibacillus aurantius]WJH35316.1 hypothetical protein N6H14_04500 [Paenibacillus sp. CC-CFT747]WNQ10591.1 hypothetical protein MJA45_23700 [Paenibacillus aurantius]
MASTRKLVTNQDLKEAMDRGFSIRVFQNDLVVGHRGRIIRFDDQTVYIQYGVSEFTYHDRDECEFFGVI